jgi:hypothetical protein
MEEAWYVAPAGSAVATPVVVRKNAKAIPASAAERDRSVGICCCW